MNFRQCCETNERATYHGKVDGATRQRAVKADSIVQKKDIVMCLQVPSTTGGTRRGAFLLYFSVEILPDTGVSST